MALITKAVRGTQDVLPRESYKNQYIERVMAETAQLFGFKEIRTPVFEHTQLFQRSVGDTTDVVQKEMYTFEDKGGRSITLRPEGTAGAARAFLEHGLQNEGLPTKTFYITSCYRYEKPQAGRLREFHQFGVECFGAGDPSADAEMLALASSIFERLGVQNLTLHLNSIGCPECRPKYHEALKAYYYEHIDDICGTCRDRLETNPMRVLDCKNPNCAELAKGAPKILDYICTECAEHFQSVQTYLDAMQIDYTIDPQIVRGLDYYTRTVFEFISTDIGSQGTVLGGGRYDGLIEELGGQHTPALGFAAGLERLKLVLENQNISFPEPERCDVYIGTIGKEPIATAMQLAFRLRENGAMVETDIVGRSVRAQMRYADKIGAKFTMVLGDSELEEGKATLKNMDTGDTKEIALSSFTEDFTDILIQDAMESLQDTLTVSEKIDIEKLKGDIL